MYGGYLLVIVLSPIARRAYRTHFLGMPPSELPAQPQPQPTRPASHGQPAYSRPAPELAEPLNANGAAESSDKEALPAPGGASRGEAPGGAEEGAYTEHVEEGEGEEAAGWRAKVGAAFVPMKRMIASTCPEVRPRPLPFPQSRDPPSALPASPPPFRRPQCEVGSEGEELYGRTLLSAFLWLALFSTALSAVLTR